jgi:hypothetical protein
MADHLKEKKTIARKQILPENLSSDIFSVKSGTDSGSGLFRHFQTYRYIGPNQFIVNCVTSSLNEAVLTCTWYRSIPGIRIILHILCQTD